MGEMLNHYMESDIQTYDPNPGFGYGLPITAVRGGIKYPTGSYGKRTPKDQRVRSTKETHMPERQTKAQIAQELQLNRDLIQQLRDRQQDLLTAQKKALPAEPPSIYVAFSVGVRFKMRGKRYTFLILRSGKQYFTTGTSPAHKRFDSWEQLCEWLEGPDVYDHTDLEILKPAERAVSFDTGAVQAVPTGASPF